MNLPHPLKNARDNREKMKREAQDIVVNYDKGAKKPVMDNKILWFVIGGFIFVFILQGLTKLIGG